MDLLTPDLPKSQPRTDQPTIFISYSRYDEKEKDQLLSHLSILQHEGLTQLWSDDHIQAGSDRMEDINHAVEQAGIAVMLISANFLASDFILGREVPALLKRRQDEGLRIVPIIAKACAWRKVSWLAQMNVLPKSGDPIWRGGGLYADEELAYISEEIANMLEFVTPVSTLLPKLSYVPQPRPPSLRDLRRWLLEIY